MALNMVVMAAGKGTRMKSALPKVLHKLAHKALLQHVLDTMTPLDCATRIVITHDALRTNHRFLPGL